MTQVKHFYNVSFEALEKEVNKALLGLRNQGAVVKDIKYMVNQVSYASIIYEISAITQRKIAAEING